MSMDEGARCDNCEYIVHSDNVRSCDDCTKFANGKLCDNCWDRGHNCAENAQMQALIDSGQAWLFEGSVGREAMAMIESGHCTLGPERRKDFWGNVVPSKFDVKSGTKGSAEYAEARQAESYR